VKSLVRGFVAHFKMRKEILKKFQFYTKPLKFHFYDVSKVKSHPRKNFFQNFLKIVGAKLRKISNI